MTHQSVHIHKNHINRYLFRPILASLCSILVLAEACLAADGEGAGSGGGLPTSVTLVATADTAAFEPSPTNNLGGMTFVPIGVTAQGQRTRGLFKFDLTSAGVPSNAVISSAVFKLNYVFGPNTNSPTTYAYDVHRVLLDWGEGTGTGGPASAAVGRPAQSNEATWRHRFAPSSTWGLAGGASGVDYAATASASANITSPGTNSFSSAGLLADVQFWRQSPAANFGWIVILRGELQLFSARRFGSSEAPVAQQRPTLTLNFELPPEVSKPRLNGNQFQFEFAARAGKGYRVERRDSFGPGSSWMLMTNIPTQNVNGTIVVAETLTLSNRFYRVGAQ